MSKEYQPIPALLSTQYQENVSLVDDYHQLLTDIFTMTCLYDPNEPDSKVIPSRFSFGLVIEPTSAYVLGGIKPSDFESSPFEIYAFTGIEKIGKSIFGISRGFVITPDGQTTPVQIHIVELGEKNIEFDHYKLIVSLDDRRHLVVKKNFRVSKESIVSIGDYRECYRVRDFTDETLRTRFDALSQLKERITSNRRRESIENIPSNQ